MAREVAADVPERQFDDGAGQLSFILTRIVAPCVIIDSFQRDFDPALGKALIISVLCTCTAMGLSILVSHLVFRKNGSHANFADKRFCVVFTNCGFMGYPLMAALFVHANTVNLRLRRAEEVLGASLSNVDHLTALRASLLIDDVKRNPLR